jgi:hypothetical protein
MTDKELLELAAKAVGFLNWTSYNTGLFVETGSRRGSTGYHWNPLTDDGDALRLAVKLGIEYRRITIPHNIGIQAYDDTIQAVFESYSDDPYATTRRAIVRAAAEIGKDMK